MCQKNATNLQHVAFLEMVLYQNKDKSKIKAKKMFLFLNKFNDIIILELS